MRVIRKHDRDEPRGWFSLFFRLGGWLALIAALVMLVVAGLMVGYARSAMLFERDGVVTQANILQRRVEVEYDDGKAKRTYFVRFFFDTPTMYTVDVERRVPLSVYEAAIVGEPRDIRYLPDEPERFEHTVGMNAHNGQTARYVGWVVGAIGLGALWHVGMKTNRAILARRDGEELVAEVTQIQRLNVQVNKRQQGRLHWQLPDGTTGRSLMRDANALATHSPGDKITVFRRGLDQWWEGDVGPRSDGDWRIG